MILRIYDSVVFKERKFIEMWLFHVAQPSFLEFRNLNQKCFNLRVIHLPPESIFRPRSWPTQVFFGHQNITKEFAS